MKLAIKLGAGFTAAAVATLMFAGSAFAAEQKCVIKDNGAFSHNKCVLVKKDYNFTWQKNFAAIGNVVVAGASTGNNSANGNTGGSTTVTAGSASVTVTITNTVNQTNN